MPSGAARSAAITTGRGMAGACDLAGERVQLRLAPRGQHQRVAGLGEMPSQRRADAGGCAGDQADRLHG